MKFVALNTDITIKHLLHIVKLVDKYNTSDNSCYAEEALNWIPIIEGSLNSIKNELKKTLDDPQTEEPPRHTISGQVWKTLQGFYVKLQYRGQNGEWSVVDQKGNPSEIRTMDLVKLAETKEAIRFNANLKQSLRKK